MANYDVIGFLIIGIIIIIFLYTILRRRGKKQDVGYDEVKFEEITYDGMHDKIKRNGIKLKKGKLSFGYNIVTKVDMFYECSGKVNVKEFHPETNVQTDTDEFVDYHFIAFKVKSRNKLLSFLNLKNDIFLINKLELKEDIKFDFARSWWTLPKYMDFFMYGGVWIADDISKEYLRKFSLSFFDETVQSALMNQPNRIIAIDTDQSKKINMLNTIAENDAKRYDNIKKGSDTTVT